MRSIYKYQIDKIHVKEITLHLEQVLTVQLQYGIPCLWAIINEDKPEKKIAVWTIGTGWDISQITERNLIYISTVQDREGYVWHYFYEVIEE